MPQRLERLVLSHGIAVPPRPFVKLLTGLPRLRRLVVDELDDGPGADELDDALSKLERLDTLSSFRADTI